MKPKPLPSLSRLKELFNYDPNTGIVTRRNRTAAVVGYSQGLGKHLCVCVDYEGYYLHRIIWKMVTGNDPADLIVDHKDTNTHNNRWENLRLVSKVTNNRNYAPKQRRYAYHGVSKIGNRYRAYVRRNGKYKHLGMFATPDEAIAAVKHAELEISKIENDTVLRERASQCG